MSYRVEVQWDGSNWTDVTSDVVSWNINSGSRADNIRPGVRVTVPLGSIQLYDESGDYHRDDAYAGRYRCRINYVEEGQSDTLEFDGFIGGRDPATVLDISSTANFRLESQVYNTWDEPPKVTSAATLRELAQNIVSEYPFDFWKSDYDDLAITAIDAPESNSLHSQLNDLSLVGGYFIQITADNKLVIRDFDISDTPTETLTSVDDILPELREWSIPAFENIRFFREGNRGRDQLNVDSGDYRAVVSSTNVNDTLTLVHFFNAPFQVEFPEAVSATLMSFTAETWVNAGPGTDAVLTSVDLLNYSGITSWIDVYTIPVSGGIGFLASDGAEWPNGDFKYRMRFRFDTDEARDVFNDHIWTFRWQISVVYDYGRVDIISGSGVDQDPYTLPSDWLDAQGSADTLVANLSPIYNQDRKGYEILLPTNYKTANIREGDLIRLSIQTAFGPVIENLIVTGYSAFYPSVRNNEPRRFIYTLSYDATAAAGSFRFDHSTFDGEDTLG